MSRVFAALVALPILLATTATATTTSSTLPSESARAQASFLALQRAFGTSDGSGLYRERYPTAKSDHRYSYEWPFSQVHVAALDLTGMPGGAANQRALAKTDAAQLHYWAKSAPGGHPGYLSSPVKPYAKGGTLFYDDNEWVGLEAMQAYAQHHHQKALHQAEKIFDLAVSGWDHNRSHPRPGGVYWMQANRNKDRNTVSNLPAAELGLRLYQVTKNKNYLTWATRMYRWTNRNLRRSDGMFYDHVDLKGHIDRSLWSYNQGVAIAVNVLMYQVKHNQRFLRVAKRIAAAAYDYFIDGNRLDSQPVYFNSILFKHLLALESITGTSRYRAAMEAYSDKLWDNNRDEKTGVFHFSSERRTDVIEQAGATQIFAILAWPRNQLRLLA